MINLSFGKLKNTLTQLLIEKYFVTISILIGKKLRCAKVLSIAKAAKAKRYSPKISKIWLIRRDMQHCIIKIDFLIFEFGHIVFLVILFMSRLAFLICF